MSYADNQLQAACRHRGQAGQQQPRRRFAQPWAGAADLHCGGALPGPVCLRVWSASEPCRQPTRLARTCCCADVLDRWQYVECGPACPSGVSLHSCAAYNVQPNHNKAASGPENQYIMHHTVCQGYLGGARLFFWEHLAVAGPAAPTCIQTVAVAFSLAQLLLVF